MTESEWTKNDNAWEMLEFVNSKISERKARLFGIWCCKHVGHLLTDQSSRAAIEVAERYVERLASKIELKRAKRAAETRVAELDYQFHIEWESWQRQGYRNRSDLDTVERQRDAARTMVELTHRNGVVVAVRAIWSGVQSALRDRPIDSQVFRHNAGDALRDIFGSPFHQSFVDPDWLLWRGGTVPKLAQTIYDDHRFDLLAILSDALQEAGCTRREILEHCSSVKPHVRGCWLIDLLLHKE
ncbi:MAG TPA: hypothetical protein VKS79_26745 [Gemmataceae bacterium]|nr:hypothetical protein [Gemmataceae bacterium]